MSVFCLCSLLGVVWGHVLHFKSFSVWCNFFDLHGAVELSQTLLAEVKLLFRLGMILEIINLLSLGMILEIINLLSPVVFCLEHSSQLHRMNLKYIN